MIRLFGIRVKYISSIGLLFIRELAGTPHIYKEPKNEGML